MSTAFGGRGGGIRRRRGRNSERGTSGRGDNRSFGVRVSSRLEPKVKPERVFEQMEFPLQSRTRTVSGTRLLLKCTPV